MLDQEEVSRLLDILGNRNRRRIIDLLRQKPCFVTEISDRLVLSPKVVIEHLAMMEREQIITFNQDERRRKYYFLFNDITFSVDLKRRDDLISLPERSQQAVLRNGLVMLRRLISARENLILNLEQIDRDIDLKIHDMLKYGKDILQNEGDLDLLIALSHYDLTFESLEELTGMSSSELNSTLARLKKNGLVENQGTTYNLSGIHAE
ncbi:ArsR/SmtB family transcription factor [Methanosphaerula palustris]|uniref:Transcriptional regulator, ArsR family n=1 Tax=Methanosphaerula palustris (strain ATCC BAA-1556 / DSM 19958 / E1-9c) TaxID=521011 RepID=B8GDK7_METPE|nr:ArsR family transcriptional regulator [Methanosphaerula palustris]ACL17358.1 transcriptional regulator, ArsR family [Methanosphaerula palustris E1-9c]